MRGGLDDALDRLARRDELRRRAAGEATGTPASVTELVEAIAAVVGRNPELAVTVGVEGAGDPVLLHFALEDGIVQVSADNSVAQRAAEPPDDDIIDIDLEEAEAYVAPADYGYEQPPAEHGEDTRRISYPNGAHPQYEEPHPFAPTPPPEVPPQTRRIHAEQQHAPEEPNVGPRMPTPLPEPIPLRVNEEETELAAKRLAALLREDPTLLRAQD
ncbi:hypothetical protein Asp14428_50070 [Actinoplanes sp. NBRC 14428]|uniref:Uncharacterized protein n=1 Tax=Pseudosporangium ferrugineum TaxID=439699 RepID=A0A2T0S6G1_9ACTN|nr:hypothetical protein [Pseudosporangium ferrugineum]PRY29000.1 hypothetical protein CLV70_107309 [Pseudosporangium ferrugineum]BCJ53532.1 hypothetical protein Asp14428_50070 [Actinoplanes sp. NBRC 14428]